MPQIHITHAISARPVTMDDIRSAYHNFIRSSQKDAHVSFDEYYAWRVNCGTQFYEFDIKEVAYYTSMKEAEASIVCNLGDIFEGGVYPYAAVLSIKEGALYGRQNTAKRDVAIYKYHPNFRMYMLIPQSSNTYTYGELYPLMNLAIRQRGQKIM